MKRAILLFWLVIALGFVISPLTAIGVETARGTPLAAAINLWVERLFEPGFNEFLLVLLAAAPFIAAAVFIWLHLSVGGAASARSAGVAGLLCAGILLSLWVLISIRTSRSSTASIGYIFLPFEVLFVMPIGYFLGRMAVKLAQKS